MFSRNWIFNAAPGGSRAPPVWILNAARRQWARFEMWSTPFCAPLGIRAFSN
jgi:hypothetical protein